jgi:hypothetical protein
VEKSRVHDSGAHREIEVLRNFSLELIVDFRPPFFRVGPANDF